jgi:hypothetical protein
MAARDGGMEQERLRLQLAKGARCSMALALAPGLRQCGQARFAAQLPIHGGSSAQQRRWGGDGDDSRR